jgi:hypothetical protein
LADFSTRCFGLIVVDVHAYQPLLCQELGVLLDVAIGVFDRESGMQPLSPNNYDRDNG